MENLLDREQEATATTTTSVQNRASDPQQRPHLSIDIPTSSAPDHLPTPTEAGIAPTTPDGSSSNSTKRRQGVPLTFTPAGGPSSSRSAAAVPPAKPPPQRSPSFMLRQTVRSLGSFKASVKGYEASLSRLFSARRMVRTSSLPLRDVDAAALSSSSTTRAAPGEKAAAVVHMCRSQSLPMNTKKSFKRMDSAGGMFRIVPSSTASSVVLPDIVPTESSGAIEDGGEDIPEEEAVCRICMVELSEGSDTTLKLECSCKGELALAHKDCAVKWFTIKGTRDCEVCKHEVRNLPVTLLRVQSIMQPDDRAGGNRPRYYSRRHTIWQGTPIVVIVSILAYFCFLEELLAARNGIAALAISLPFSCILGLFSSLTTTSMVARRYVWIYAALQFLFVVFFTHLFYGFLHLQAVISIILATFAGFGVGMTGNSIIAEILRWRVRGVALPTADARRRSRRAQQAPLPAPDQTSSQHSAAAAAAANQGQSHVENPAVVPQA